ncbi:hypothetical protein ASE11_24825 [Hydrogenophaga sp. Root209]|uniref:hypothetical protein n=1 Tax=Hydrogenophaga sp. Root209 TaxID=1736490 RepID=UPI0006FE5141|nr:hypothetical protein [Hydrogenophaga sp. Root209]KRC03849.1 hypothetical protein ASE11_24825 [Hydrogenophaga sp. Root209]
MPHEKHTVNKLLTQFKSLLLERLHFEHVEVEIDPTNRAGLSHLALIIPVEGVHFRVLVEVKRHAFPRDIDVARRQLEALSRKDGSPEKLMVWADSLSEGARRALQSMGIGYFDGSGSLSLTIGPRQILIDRPPLKPQWRDVGTLFTPERAKVLHALLLEWRSWRSGVDLVVACGASPNTVSVLMRELEKRGMVKSEGVGRAVRRQLLAPEELLDAWAQYGTASNRRKTRWFSYAQNPASLPAFLAKRMDEKQRYMWAFTGQYAANSLSPHLTAVDGYDLIVPAGASEDIAHHLELKPADRGFNVTLHECEEFAFQHLTHLKGRPGWFASSVIQYLDLARAGGRSQELAAELKKIILNGSGEYVDADVVLDQLQRKLDAARNRISKNP